MTGFAFCGGCWFLCWGHEVQVVLVLGMLVPPSSSVHLSLLHWGWLVASVRVCACMLGVKNDHVCIYACVRVCVC